MNWRLANMKESAPMRSAAGGEGGQGQHHAERHDREHGTQCPAVDRPPPLADDAAVVARNLDHCAFPTRSAPGSARAISRNASPRCS
jgi:hypothetical protein